MKGKGWFPDENRPWHLCEVINFYDYHGMCNAHCVYGWFRDDECLYIGESGRGLNRIFSHTVIDRIEPLLPHDEIRIIWCIADDVLHVESYLIDRYKPKYNKSPGYGDVKLSRPLGIGICEICGKEFKQRLWWQTRCVTENGTCKRRLGMRNEDIKQEVYMPIDIKQFLKPSASVESTAGDNQPSVDSQT
jgi:hypothetical protein